jgi:hypothetical protein
MRWWSWVGLAGVLGVVTAFVWLPWFRPPKMTANVRPVPGGDQEIAWLHNPTSYETWENYVLGVKRAEMHSEGGPNGLEVDDSGAYPDKTTAVPEIIIRRKGFTGALRVRWYKVTDDAPQEAWVQALARRDPPPLVVLAGWTSDRAKTLADTMREVNWQRARPLYFLATATADKVEPDDDNASGGQVPPLISLYDRSFRFCFTNQQMARAVTDFVLSDPTLRPGPIVWPGLPAVQAMAANPISGVISLGVDTFAREETLPSYAISWEDDPYSKDLSLKFREAFREREENTPGLIKLTAKLYPVPFSTGRLNRPTAVEAQNVESILADLPPPGMRTVLIIPTVTNPARRTLRALVQGNPAVGHQIVAVTGDGLGVNAFFRDRDFAWPVRSLPVPFVQFTHADPFAWDYPGTGPTPPAGYELSPPTSGGVRSSTEDIRLFTRMTRVLAKAAFQEGTTALEANPDTIAERLHTLKPALFDQAGNRLDGTGEHVVVLRPTFAENIPGKHHIDGILEVYERKPSVPGWTRLHTLPLGRAPLVGQSE